MCQGDVPHASALRRRDLSLPIGPPNRELAPLEVDVCPFQGHHLSTSQPRVTTQQHSHKRLRPKWRFRGSTISVSAHWLSSGYAPHTKFRIPSLKWQVRAAIAHAKRAAATRCVIHVQRMHRVGAGGCRDVPRGSLPPAPSPSISVGMTTAKPALLLRWRTRWLANPTSWPPGLQYVVDRSYRGWRRQRVLTQAWLRQAHCFASQNRSSALIGPSPVSPVKLIKSRGIPCPPATRMASTHAAAPSSSDTFPTGRKLSYPSSMWK